MPSEKCVHVTKRSLPVDRGERGEARGCIWMTAWWASLSAKDDPLCWLSPWSRSPRSPTLPSSSETSNQHYLKARHLSLSISRETHQQIWAWDRSMAQWILDCKRWWQEHRGKGFHWCLFKWWVSPKEGGHSQHPRNTNRGGNRMGGAEIQSSLLSLKQNREWVLEPLKVMS